MNRIKVFKDRLLILLRASEEDQLHFQLQKNQNMSDMCFGCIDALREVIAWANILEEST